MTKPNFNDLFDTVKDAISDNLPQILTGSGIVCMVIGTVHAVKKADEAKKKLDEALSKKVEENGEGSTLTVIEKVKVAGPIYSTSIIFTVAGASMLIGSNIISEKRNAALAAAYTMTSAAFNRYRSSVVETMGEKKEQAVRAKSAKKELDKKSSSNIVMTGNGDTLCMDDWSGIKFYSNIDKIRNAINNINEDLVQGNELYYSLNSVYRELDIDPTTGGELLGWNFSRDGQIKANFEAILTDEGKPCILMMLDPYPSAEFDKLSY